MSDKPPVSIGPDQRQLVVRSRPPAGLKYPACKPYLRHDFFYSCAYCTIAESEATALRMTIDHYEPRSARPDLEHDYNNLLYACDECNMLKGDRSPPPDARAAGRRFFRPDEDLFDGHFDGGGLRLNPRSETGRFSIEGLDLNRQSLRRLRELRMRFTECNRYVAEGVFGLRTFKLDLLPPAMKAQAASAIKRAASLVAHFQEDIDDFLRDRARSPLDSDATNADEERERSDEREAYLRQSEALYPGVWKTPRKRRRKDTRR